MCMVITEYLYYVQPLLFHSKNNVIGRNNHIWIIKEKITISLFLKGLNHFMTWVTNKSGSMTNTDKH